MHTRNNATPARDYPPGPVEEPLLISVPEAARLLGVGTTFGWTMVRRGEMPTVKLGRRVLVPRTAIERLADAARAEQGAQEGDRDRADPRRQPTPLEAPP